MTMRMNDSDRSLGRVAFLVVPLLLLSLASVAAQQTLDPRKPYALIFGTVYGPDSRPAANIKIKIRRGDQKKDKWELVSDRRGEFAQRFPAGAADYYVRAVIDKKYHLENKEVKVHVDSDERQDIALHLTSVETPQAQQEAKVKDGKK